MLSFVSNFVKRAIQDHPVASLIVGLAGVTLYALRRTGYLGGSSMYEEYNISRSDNYRVIVTNINCYLFDCQIHRLIDARSNTIKNKIVRFFVAPQQINYVAGNLSKDDASLRLSTNVTVLPYTSIAEYLVNEFVNSSSLFKLWFITLCFAYYLQRIDADSVMILMAVCACMLNSSLLIIRSW